MTPPEMKSLMQNCAGFFLYRTGSHNIPAILILAILTLLMFGDVLFFSDGQILSRAGLDLFAGEMSGLDFQFRELKNGHFPLWNPHVFSGTPFIPVAFYIPNLIFLLLPLASAINTSISLHVFLIGCFMFFWTQHRGLSPIASLLSSVLLMFSSPFFMHVYAGHMGNLWAMTWVPLIFFCVDRIIEEQNTKWVLWGIFAVSMQIFTGQVQYVYYTAITIFIYALLRILPANNRLHAIFGLACLLIGAFTLSAVQIFNIFHVGSEGVRSGGLSYAFTAMFSFPPENLLTLLTPNFFGDMTKVPYWGRCYLWEMSLFFSVSGLFLALFAIFADASSAKRYSVFMLIVLFILALGAHTPLFHIFYDYLPGFDSFRGSSKFIFFAMLFMTALAGSGFDALRRTDAPLFKSAVILLGSGLLLAALASILYSPEKLPTAERIWGKIMGFIAATGESYLPPEIYTNPSFIHDSGTFAALGLSIAAAVLLLLALLLYAGRFSRKILFGIVILACCEGFVFAYFFRPTFDTNMTQVSDLSKFYRAHPGDYRVLSLFNPNTAMSTQAKDIWGYGPVVQKRYAEFIAYTQEMNPDQASTYIPFKKIHPLYQLLRLRYLLIRTDGKILIQENKTHMPRVQLIRDVKIIRNRDPIFSEMGKSSFNPRQTVILESDPSLEIPQGPQAGEEPLRIMDESSDHLTIHARLSAPAILLITDNYSRGWRATNMRKNSGVKYEVLPADYTLMAIPLVSGEHLFTIDYVPAEFTIGKWLSIISLLIILLFIGYRRFSPAIYHGFSNKKEGGATLALPFLLF